MHRIALILGIIGSVIGLVSAISALTTVGADPTYGSRLWLGWVTLILAVVASAAVRFLNRRPLTASLIMLISSIAGFVCINLFYINTGYALAIPFWILAVVVELGARASIRYS